MRLHRAVSLETIYTDSAHCSYVFVHMQSYTSVCHNHSQRKRENEAEQWEGGARLAEENGRRETVVILF